MGKRHSETFKKRAVEKALRRGDGISMLQTSNDIGVASGTLYHWISKARKSGFTEHSSPEKRPQDWHDAEKLRAIIETSALDEEDLNSYCRRNGIYKHHIEQWKQDMANTNNNPDKAENRALRAENKQLKKELRRKEKALAETAALLVLQKKVAEIWGSEEEED
jgi:transposase-like protein